MLCVRCGAAIPDGPDFRFCRACGAPLSQAAAVVQTSAAGAAALAPVSGAYPPMAANGQGQAAAPVLPMPPPAGLVQVAIYPYAGFWVRLLAWAIDQAILAGTCALALFTLGAAQAIAADFVPVESEMPSGVVWLVMLAVGIPYWLLFPPALGATPGKMMLGYHIVGVDGRHVGLKRSLGRMLAQLPSAMVLGLGYIWIAFDSRKRSWHDQIAGTVVVRKELARP